MGDIQQIAALHTANEPTPVYEINYQDVPVALYCSRVGAPAAAVGFEEIIAMGIRTLVLFGSCGVLAHDIADGHFIVPTHALRDEGVSYHYLPAADEIPLSSVGIDAVTATMDIWEFAYTKGKTWTTDAIYRETRGKVAQRKKQGCIAVEMECAALAAVAAFRNVTFAPFFYAADNLDAPCWDRRSLGKRQLSHQEVLLAIALEAAIRLQ